MHTDTDKEIGDLIVERTMIEANQIGPLDARSLEKITGINLQIMRLQGKQAHQPRTDATADAVKSLLQDGRNADARRFADQVAGIEERIVWTTKDGKRWDRLEDAITHQRRGKIIEAIYEADDNNADWIATNAEQIADNAAALFAILEPFFRKGE